MVTSIALIIIFGMFGKFFFTKIKLPGLLGMLIVGVLIGPYGINFIHPTILNISSDLRRWALIIILLRAGLGLNLSELKKVGKTALLMSFIPGLIEGLVVAWLAIYLLNFNFTIGGMLGFILAAVSPAVVVPFMLKLIEERRGTKKGIPFLILSAASIDDVFAITIFTAFLGYNLKQNNGIVKQLLNIPISIGLGIMVGLITGSVLLLFFKKFRIRDSKKVLMIMSFAILMTALEQIVSIASLLGVMALGMIISEKKPDLSQRLSIKFNKIWVFAELILFVLVGAEVNVKLALHAGFLGIIIILIGLIARSIGVMLSTIKSGLNVHEKLFLIVSYLPKATVQAAIGGIPLSYGLVHGDLILAIAVLSIVITATLGAIGMNYLAPKLLKIEESS